MHNPMVRLGTAFLLILALTTGCGRHFNNTDVDGWVRPKVIQAELADELSNSELRKIRFDHFLLEALEVNGDSRYQAFFGGSDAVSAARYIDKRVNFVAKGPRKKKTNGAEVVASNLGIGLFLKGIRDGRFEPVTWTYGEEMTPNSPDNGLIVIQAYEDYDNIERAETWTHEARHSDCPEIISREDAALVLEGEDRRPKHLSREVRQCGYLHAVCPKKHALAGIPACDDRRDGAYGYGLEWTRTVRDTCKNCDGSIKDAAAVMVIDYESRIVE